MIWYLASFIHPVTLFTVSVIIIWGEDSTFLTNCFRSDDKFPESTVLRKLEIEREYIITLETVINFIYECRRKP